jgi:quercetin dioxygenase-like cupin family protein
MKLTIGAAALLATALGSSAITWQVQQKMAQTERFPQFDNDEVKVWKTVIQPKQPLTMHHHDHGRVLVALTGGTLNIVEPSGAKEVLPLEGGKAYWLPAMAPGAVHSDVDAGDKPIEVMVVELQHDMYTKP